MMKLAYIMYGKYFLQMYLIKKSASKKYLKFFVFIFISYINGRKFNMIQKFIKLYLVRTVMEIEIIYMLKLTTKSKNNQI